MGLTERHFFEDEEPKLTENQLEDVLLERDKAYKKGYVDAMKNAVPLDKLCEWLSERSINIPCTSCANLVNEYCTAFGDTSRPCPKTADDWRRAITEWMEKQDEDNI